MSQFLLVLDEGTTSTRAMLFRPDGTLTGSAQRPLTQHYPAPGQVEHDAAEIWAKTLAVAREMVDAAGGAGQIAAIGITNQRETGRRLGPLDRRAPRHRAGLAGPAHRRPLRRAQGRGAMSRWVQSQTGLLLDPYFSATKIGWMLQHRPDLQAAGDRLAFGTIDSWLVWKLTGGAVHATDATNASRTMLMALMTAIGTKSCAACSASTRAPCPDRRLRGVDRHDRPRPVRRRHPNLRHGRRPAGGDHRPGLPPAGRH